MTDIGTANGKASFGNLIIAETRKLVDTRASVWLLSITAALSLIIAGVSGWAVTQVRSGTVSWPSLVFFPAMPVNALLPVVAILMVTAEWSHRTALTTFVMTPRRHLVAAAQGIVAAAASVVATVLVLVLTGISWLVATTFQPSVTLIGANWKALLGATATTLIYVLVGFALGLAFLNAPAAIIVILLVPTTVLPMATIIKQLRAITPWINYFQACLLYTSPSPRYQRGSRMPSSA